MRLEIKDNGFCIFLTSGKLLLEHSTKKVLMKVGVSREFLEGTNSCSDVKYEDKLSLDCYRIIQHSTHAWSVALSYDIAFQEEIRISYMKQKESVLSIESTFPARFFNRYWMHMCSPDDEFLFGGGQQSTYFNLKGGCHHFYLHDEILSKGSRKEPFSLVRQPSFLSSRGYALVVEGAQHMTLDAKSSDYIDIEVLGGLLAFVIIEAESLLKVVQAHSDYLGRVVHFPRWILDKAVVGFRGSIRRIQNSLARLDSFGILLSAIWLQDWAYTTFPFLSDRFTWNWFCAEHLKSALSSKINVLYNQGTKSIAYMNGLLPEGSLLFNEADSLGYLVNTKNMETYFYSYKEFNLSFIDLTNPRAFEWFIGIIQQHLLDLGIRAWVIDDGAQLPTDGVLYQNKPSHESQYLWPYLLTKASVQASVRSQLQHEVVILSTTGYLHSACYTHAFVLVREYLLVKKEGWSLKPTFLAILSGSVSGYGIQVSVVGLSYGEQATAELIIRHAELTVFTAFFWFEESDTMYQSFCYYEDRMARDYLVRLTILYEEIAYYRQELLTEYHTLGSPLNRPLFLHYQDDPVTFTIDDQFMLGSEIMIAPILVSGEFKRKVYFPAGRWRHFFSKMAIDGPIWQELQAPLGMPLAFYKEESSYQLIFSKASYYYNDGLHFNYL